MELYEFLRNPIEILCVLIIISSIFLILYKFYKKFVWIDPDVKQMLSKLTSPPRHPIIGHAFQLAVSNTLILKRIFEAVDILGTLFVVWLANQPYIFVTEGKYVEKIVSSSVNIHKSQDYKFLENWLGTGLLTSNGKKWHNRRKLLTPTFHFKILEDFIEVFNEQSAVLIQILTGRAEGNAFDICPYVGRCTLDIICETAMGEKINAQRFTDSEYVKTTNEMSALLMFRIVRPWLRMDAIWDLFYGRKEQKLLKILHGFTEKVIRQRKTNFSNSIPIRSDELLNPNNPLEGKRRLAFLDLLLEASEGGNVLTDLDVREETDTFMFEGQDTTSASINWTILLLALHQECQNSVRQELFEIFGDDPHRQITFADLSQMKYLECCIKESLRLFPSVPYFSRQLEKDIDFGDDKVVPRNSIVVVTTYVLHRNEKVFPNPERFEPERFEPENCVGRNPYSYIPFSAGPRNCIGQKFAIMEEKVILARIFLNFKIEAAERMEDVQPVPDIVLRSKNGVRVKLTKI